VTSISWDPNALHLSDGRHPLISFEIGIPQEGFRAAHSVRDSRALLNRLFNKGAQTALVSDVLAQLRADPTVSEPARALAIELALARGDDINRLNGYAWDSVRIPELSALHPHALHQIEYVSSVLPDDTSFLNTLALARYRMGLFDSVISATLRADDLSRARNRPPYPGDAAIRAMGSFRLGRLEAAHGKLSLSRTSATQPPFADDPDSKWLLLEASALIESSPATRPRR
jgi:hypothetical protein